MISAEYKLVVWEKPSPTNADHLVPSMTEGEQSER